MLMGNYMCARDVVVSMSSNASAAGMNHLTVVPENFERDGERCPACGTPLDGEHDANDCQDGDYF